MGWDKSSLIRKTKGEKTRKKEETMHSAISHHQLIGAQLVPRQGQPTPSQLLPVSSFHMTPHGMGYPFVWFCPFPASCVPSAYSLAKQCKKLNIIGFVPHCSGTTETSWFFNIVLIPNSKQSTKPDTGKKVTSIPVEIRTSLTLWNYLRLLLP